MKKYVYYVVYSYNSNNNTKSGYGYLVQTHTKKITNQERVEEMHRWVKHFIEQDEDVIDAQPIVTNFSLINEYEGDKR